MDPKDRIIVAVDTNNIKVALEIVLTLKPHVGMFKFGLELLNTILVQSITTKKKTLQHDIQYLFTLVQDQLFWDGKWDDIPNTVSATAKAVSVLQPKMVNVHASAGIESIKAAVNNSPNSIVLGVTVLTSISPDDCLTIFGNTPLKKVGKFAEMLVEAGAKGIVCSPKELPLISLKYPQLVKVVPGIRPQWAHNNDQQRVTTPSNAIENGADYLVIGRPITHPPTSIGNPINAVKKIIEEIGDC